MGDALEYICHRLSLPLSQQILEMESKHKYNSTKYKVKGKTSIQTRNLIELYLNLLGAY